MWMYPDSRKAAIAKTDCMYYHSIATTEINRLECQRIQLTPIREVFIFAKYELYDFSLCK